MKVELTNGEVRSIGERRWLKAYWKRLAVGFAVSVAVVVLADSMVPEDLTGWGKSAILIVALLPYCIVCFVWVRKQDKAGKRLLVECQDEVSRR